MWPLCSQCLWRTSISITFPWTHFGHGNLLMVMQRKWDGDNLLWHQLYIYTYIYIYWLWMEEILHHQKDGWNPLDNGILLWQPTEWESAQRIAPGRLAITKVLDGSSHVHRPISHITSWSNGWGALFGRAHCHKHKIALRCTTVPWCSFFVAAHAHTTHWWLTTSINFEKQAYSSWLLHGTTWDQGTPADDCHWG